MKIMFLSITFSSVYKNPLFLGIMLIFFSLFLSFICLKYISSWLSLLLILVYISGVLIVFAYFISLESNQSLKNFKEYNFLMFGMLFLNMNFMLIYSMKKNCYPLMIYMIMTNKMYFLFFVIILLMILVMIINSLFLKSFLSLRKFF